MATTRLIQLEEQAPNTGVRITDSMLVAVGEAGAERRATIDTLLECLGVEVVTASTLPSGATRIIFVSDGRKAGEGVGAGTGVLCLWNGSNWVTADAGTTVAA